jgi:hypothetical protein
MARDTLSRPFDFAPVTDYRKYIGGASLRVTKQEKVNGFWAAVCQYVPSRAKSLAENPIDCRIFFADNPERKTESGIGGKTLETPEKASNPAVCGPSLGPQLPRPHVV